MGVGEGPTFECVWFSLAGRSPLLQHYLVTHGLAEAKEEGIMEATLGPVIGRTQISHLPYPPVMITICCYVYDVIFEELKIRVVSIDLPLLGIVLNIMFQDKGLKYLLFLTRVYPTF